MSRNAKPNLGEPYQIYSEVVNAGKNVQGSKRKCRWLIGFTEREGEVEVALVHSVVSGKKTIFEDGREITSSTNYLATDFGHTWRSETCPGRLFRVEFVMSMTTEPTEYTFMVDGIKFVDMPKKGSIGGGDYRRGSNYGGESQPRTINGFGGGAPSSRSSGTSSGFGKQSGTGQSHSASASAAPAPTTTASSNRRYIYDDDEEDEQPAPAAAAPVRGSFQSPGAPAPAAASNNSGFGFDPFAENPGPAPAAKSSAAGSLFNAFDESPPATKANTKSAGGFDAFGGGDPFASSSDPFATPAPAAAPQRQQAAPKAGTAPKSTPPPAAPAPKATPNFFDDDFAAAPAPATAPTSGFGDAFPTSVHNTPAPARRSSVEISQDFAGLSFAAPAPPAPQPTAAAQLFAASEPEPEPTPPPAPVSNDPWAAAGNLVNLDLMNTNAPAKRASVTDKGPSLASMMTSPSGGVPTNSRASFTAGPGAANPLDLFNTAPAPTPMMGGAPMGGMNSMNSRASFTAGPGAMGGMGGPAPMGGMGGAPMGGMGMGGAPMGGMSGMNAPGPRSSMTGGPIAMAPAMGMAPAGGAMGGNTRGSFVSANPPAGFGAPQQPPKSSLDTLDWKM